MRSQFNAILAIMLLGIMLSASFPLEAISGNLGMSKVSLLQTSPTYNVDVSPNYIREGFNTTLTVSVQAANDTACYFRINVTDPAGTSCAANISVATNAVGYGVNSTRYWGNFSGAHTNLLGIYNVLLKNATTDETLHSANFLVGLTDKLRYRRNEDVSIRGSGYNASENAAVNITTSGISVTGYPKNRTASTKGVVTDIWRVPINATLGNYTIIIANATTPGTVKPVLDTWNFTVFGKTSYSVEAQPDRIQEGQNTTITVTIMDAAVYTTYVLFVNVTDPGGRAYNASLPVSTNATGFGSNSIKHWGNFTGGNTANTHYVGNYTVTVTNETSATTSFAVGLTDKTTYRREETVQIQASGYNASELVAVNIKIGTFPLENFPQTIEASVRGNVAFNWTVPLNATPETYTITLNNATSGGTMKMPRDAQDFEVLGVVCKIQTKNQAGEGVPDVAVEVYNATTPDVLLRSGTTTSIGSIRLNLDVGNYTFKTLLNGVQVGNFNETITQDHKDLDFTLNLTNVRIIVKDASGGLPLIDLLFSYKYNTTRTNLPKSEVVPKKTNTSGIVEIHNVFTDLSYLLEARRYDFPLPGSPWENKTLSLPWNNVTILVPTYTALVRVLDSKGGNVSDVRIAAYEWSSGATQPVPNGTRTSVEGSVAFSLTFGKYRLRALDDSLVLNETTLDLIENNLNFTFHLTIFRLDVTVWVRDYFGQPIANANVTIERKMGERYVTAYTRLTGPDGSVQFTSAVGGDSRISVYVSGKVAAGKTQFLATDSNHVEFRIGGYVAVLGYPIGTGLFVSFSFILVLVVFVPVLTRRRWVQAFRKKRKG